MLCPGKRNLYRGHEQLAVQLFVFAVELVVEDSLMGSVLVDDDQLLPNAGQNLGGKDLPENLRLLIRHQKCRILWQRNFRSCYYRQFCLFLR